LRAAIQEANALPGDDIIILPALPPPNAYVLELFAELIVSSNLTITGGGAATTIIDGNKDLRTNLGVIIINVGSTVTISAATIRNGARRDGGGGIANSGALALVNSTVSGNRSVNSESGGRGGGIRNDGTLTVTNSTVSGNLSDGDNASLGGGIYNTGTAITTVNTSTISGNSADSGGGGIYAVGTLTLTNSTVSGNNAGGFGGGIYNLSTASLFNVTITNNTANLTGSLPSNVDGAGGGVFNDATATVSFRNSIILGNRDHHPTTPLPNDCKGTIASLGNNVMGDFNLGCTINGAGINSVNSFGGPYLGVLQNNGGPTQTHALLANNPAINGGNVLGCRDQFGAPLTTDQRGLPRPSPGTNCDAGAFESQAILCPTNSLQAAIDNATAGQIILVMGTCSENLIVRNEKQRITIDGSGAGTGTRATLFGNFNSPTVNIRGKGILLQNFNIENGSDGVHINRGSNAVLHNNVIQGSVSAGVLVDELAFAVITANTIENHFDAAIHVDEQSTARIGFNSDADTVAAANLINNNGGFGIRVTNGSSARIIGNVIQNNLGDGIQVIRDSHADIASNGIYNNADGIELGENSSVQLGEDTGTSIFEAANTAAASFNNDFGVNCVAGGIANGRLGSLNGIGGAKSFAGSCIDSLIP
jgi:predicted outer membrane repeat protein